MGQGITFKWFQIWVLSGHVTLPFPGSWIEQPTYVTEDFLTYKLVERWHRLNGTLPSVDGLPKMDEVA